jgi:hypothetical protein
VSERAETFVREIVERFPKLSPLLREHLHDNSGELLPHVFFGDLTRYAVALLTAPTAESKQGASCASYSHFSKNHSHLAIQNCAN